MTNNIIKFLYKSQFVMDKTPTAGSTNPVTSDGILKALENIASSKLSLVQSGYMADNVAEKVKPFDIVYDNGIKLGNAINDQKLYEPDGIDEITKRHKFKEHIIPAGTFVTDLNEIDIDGAIDCEVFICYDFLNEELVSLPARTAVPDTPNVIQWMYAQSQDANGEGPRVGEDSYDAVWWDYTANKMKKFGGVWTTNVSMSLPLAIGLRKGGITKEIVTDFSMAGACGKVTWVVPGASYVFCDGRKELNGLLNVSLASLETVICKEVIFADKASFQDYHLYISNDGKIIGPSDNVQLNSTTGYYEYGGQDNLVLCRYAYISADLVNKENPNETTYITSIVPFDVVTIATSDDIEDLLRLINNRVQVELSDVHNSLDKTIADLEALTIRVGHNETDISSNILSAMQIELNSVRKRQYKLKNILPAISNLNQITGASKGDVYYVEGTKSFYVYNGSSFEVLPDDSSYEVIEGIKEFKSTIVGNLDGVANYDKKAYINSGEIMPMGVKVVAGKNVSTYTDKETANVMTSVRIGSNYVTATYFKGTATQAQYADLAEIYEADEEYIPGTLVEWGGEKEITAATNMVNGVISTNPAYLMNSNAKGLPVALVGRVPVLVEGPVNKFDTITLSKDNRGIGIVAKEGNIIIARALETNLDDGIKLVECVVRFSI